MSDTFTAQRINEAILDICTADIDEAKKHNLITVRKPHECGHCGLVIEKGQESQFFEGRAPRYDEQGKQVGIEYYRAWACADYDACHRRYLDKENTCIRCGIEQAKRGKLCGRCLVEAFADLMEECPPPETPEEVDEALRDFGLDPDEVEQRMAEVARKALEEVGSE